jgi:Leucine-rich repeat (LRR) protein
MGLVECISHTKLNIRSMKMVKKTKIINKPIGLALESYMKLKNLKIYNYNQKTKKMKKSIISISLIFVALIGFGQKDSVYTSLEAAISNKDSVYHLRLQNTKLETIPSEVFELKNLIFLSLGSNLISELDERLIELQNLQFLSLTNNRL